MTAVFDRPASMTGRTALLASRHWPEIMLAAALIGAFAMLRHMPVSHDVVWQMWVARQLIGGASLYTGIVELNPPLWFWMGIPVERFAQALSATSESAIVAALFLLSGAALALLATLWSNKRSSHRALLLGAAFAAFITIPLSEFGQREHICLIGTTVYVALLGRRVSGLQVDWRLAALAGLLAAAGFALKHYFVLVPLLLEVWLIGARGRAWSPVRPETLVLAGAAAVYTAAVVLFTPEFFTIVVPHLRIAYGDYGAAVLGLLTGPTMSIWIISLVVLLWATRTVSALPNGFAIAAIAFVVAYLAQQKGWPYHAMPVNACLFLALASALLQLEGTRWDALRMVSIAGCMLIPLHGAYAAGTYDNANEAAFGELMRDANPGSGALVITAYPSHAWPMVETAGLKWPSRHFAFWMVHAFADQMKRRGELTEEMSVFAESVRRQTVEDLECNLPDHVIVDESVRSPAFDFLAYLRKSPEFERLFARYVRTRQVGMYTLYALAGGHRPLAHPQCRTLF